MNDLTDAELVLLDAVILSGGQVKPHDRHDAEEATEAVLLDARFRAAVKDELRVRHLEPAMVAGHLVERALDRLR